jgi:hypothetical protein
MFTPRIFFAPLIAVLISATAPVIGSSAQPDLDPAALDLLKSTLASITGSKAFSFKARIARDRLATNNQIVTYYNDDVITVSRPDKVRIDIDGEHDDVQFFFDAGKATIFDPEKKLYVSHSAPNTIDGMLQTLEKLGVSFPMSDLLQSNPYESLSSGLQTAYVLGRVDIANKTFIHLLFTEAAADWQLWVTPGEKPLPRGLTIVYKSQPGSPRITMDLTDWNLDAQPQQSFFEFVKPDDAHEIQFLPKGGDLK